LVTIVIIGGGQAGAQAIETLRREGFDGRLVLVGDEAILPYQRPPLSKKFMSGDLSLDRLFLRHQSFYDEHRIELKLGVSAVRLEPCVKRVSLSSGEQIVYDLLLLCTGATPRMLNCPGAELAGVRYLRCVDDVPAIQNNLMEGKRVVIIGGGYIGLELAATARQRGSLVTVLEMADRVMNRVVAQNVSEYFTREHRAQGVKIVCNAQLLRFEVHDGVARVLCADGSSYSADLVLAGVGAVPRTDLAVDAGLTCENGVVVDEHCRTSNEHIFAAGDCTNQYSPRFDLRVRLESVDNAFEQAKTAAFNMLGTPVVHNRVPWFWSDQYDNKLFIVGLSQKHDREVTRGDPAARSFAVCYLRGGELTAVEAINRTKDHMAARKLISDRARPQVDKLGDILLSIKDAC
jgi:3-phenylpropionate/trans-cinnamate dioxygenase ferredoxin reductase component